MPTLLVCLRSPLDIQPSKAQRDNGSFKTGRTLGCLRSPRPQSESSDQSAVRIEPWGKGDLALLEQLLGDPAMMVHLGGPESPEKIAERQTRYEQASAEQARMFKIVDEATGEGVGWVGYWERTWRGGQVYEIGWSVLPAFQGRGIAGKGTDLALEAARSQNKHRFVHAFPAVDNAPSNAICRKLSFTLLEEREFEFPSGSGSFMRCNDWRLDLFARR